MVYYDALYSYTPASAHELQLVEGEVVTEIEADNGDGWTTVVGQNGTGLVPSSYIQKKAGGAPVPPPPTTGGGGLGSIKALYAFADATPGNLNLEEGAVYTLLETGSDWWKARDSQGGEGFVPASYVEPCADPRPRADSGQYGFPSSPTTHIPNTIPSTAGSNAPPSAPVAPTTPGSGSTFSRHKPAQSSYRESPTERRRREENERTAKSGQVDKDVEAETASLLQEVEKLSLRAQEGEQSKTQIAQKIAKLQEISATARVRAGISPQQNPATILALEQDRFQKINQLLA